MFIPLNISLIIFFIFFQHVYANAYAKVKDPITDTSYINRLHRQFTENVNCRPDSAEILAGLELSLSIESDYKQGIIRGYNDLGTAYMNKNLFTIAYELYTSAMNTAGIEKFPALKADILTNLGVLLKKTGDIEEAVNYYLEALAVYKELGIYKGVAAIRNNLGILYLADRRIEKAKAAFMEALSISRNINDKIGIKSSLKNLANIYFVNAQTDSALLSLNQCLIIEKEMNDSAGLCRTLENIGNYYLDLYEKGMADSSLLIQAGNFFRQELGIAKKIKDKIRISSGYYNISQTEYYSHNTGEAVKYADSCLDFSGDDELLYDIAIDAYQLLSTIHSGSGRFEKSGECLTAIIRLLEKKPDRNGQSDIMELEHNYFKQKEKQMHELAEKQRHRMTIIVLSCLLILALALATFIFFILRYRQKRIRAEQDNLRFKAIIDTQEQERARFARDLHDELGPVVSASVNWLTGIEDRVEYKEQDDKEMMKKTIDTLNGACQTIREISYNLMPAGLQTFGLIKELKELIYKVNSARKIKIHFTESRMEQRLPPATELACYRITGEAINNIIRHSGAGEAYINISRGKNTVRLEISDNGKGFDIKSVDAKRGKGIENIKARTALLGGKIDIISQPGSGTAIKITFNV